MLSSVEPSLLNFTENDSATVISQTVTINDADSSILQSATIEISNNFNASEDQLGFTNQNGISGSYDAASGVLSLTGSATLANYESALRSVTYINTSDNPDPSVRTVSFSASDGSGISNLESRNITVDQINDSSVITNIENSSLFYVENSAAVPLTDTLTIIDLDNTMLSSASIVITDNFSAGDDSLVFFDQNGITGSYNAVSGTLQLTGSASVPDYQAAIRSVSFQNSSDDPDTSPRTVSITVNDGLSASNVGSRVVSVVATNDAPVTDNIETTSVSYQEGAGPIVLSNSLSLSDLDHAFLTSATVTISGNHQPQEDQLSVAAGSGITYSYDAASGILSLSGTASISVYEAALRSVSYENTSDQPVNTDRTVSFSVSDGVDSSNFSVRVISVSPVNDAPVLTTTDNTPLIYTENDGTVPVFGLIDVIDADDVVLTSATVSISGNYTAAEDVLQFNDQPGITGIFDPLTGSLVLSGNAPLADYATALANIAYVNNSDNPNTCLLYTSPSPRD